MSYTIIIPARYASVRFPGKLLATLGDKTVLQHVYERARASAAERVIVATDDARIDAAASAFGATVCMTSARHASGAERLAEVVEYYAIDDDAIIVNLQGDEPFIAVALLQQVADLLSQAPGYGMATMCHAIKDAAEIANPNIVKVVIDNNGDALYFSRAAVPWGGDGDGAGATVHYRHIGLYAYTARFLREYVKLPVCALEKAEKLEQLRALFHGQKIRVGVTTEKTGIGIDTPADLAKAEAMLRKDNGTYT